MMQQFWGTVLRFGMVGLILYMHVWRRQFHKQSKVADEQQEFWICLQAFTRHLFSQKCKQRISVTWGILPWPGYDSDPSGQRISGICWEAPVCIVVLLEGRPVCGMGLEIVSGHICIRQLQGVAGVVIPKELSNWPQLFVEATKLCLARVPHTFASLTIASADQRISYWRPMSQELKLINDAEYLKQHRQRLRRRYDGTARQMNFKLHKSGAYWHQRVG